MRNFSNASTFYVSQVSGNSRYSGLTPQADQNGNGPLPSLEQALRKIRELRRGGMKQPVSIKIMDSVYTLKQTLVIDEATDAVTIEPFSTEPVTISGGRRITGFTRSVFRGTDCFAAFIPEVKSGEWAFTDLYVDGIRADLTRYPETGFMVPEGVENPPRRSVGRLQVVHRPGGRFPRRHLPAGGHAGQLHPLLDRRAHAGGKL